MYRTIPVPGSLQSLSGMRLCRFPVDFELFSKLVRPPLCPEYQNPIDSQACRSL